MSNRAIYMHICFEICGYMIFEDIFEDHCNMVLYFEYIKFVDHSKIVGFGDFLLICSMEPFIRIIFFEICGYVVFEYIF